MHFHPIALNEQGGSYEHRVPQHPRQRPQKSTDPFAPKRVRHTYYGTLSPWLLCMHGSDSSPEFPTSHKSNGGPKNIGTPSLPHSDSNEINRPPTPPSPEFWQKPPSKNTPIGARVWDPGFETRSRPRICRRNTVAIICFNSRKIKAMHTKPWFIASKTRKRRSRTILVTVKKGRR